MLQRTENQSWNETRKLYLRMLISTAPGVVHFLEPWKTNEYRERLNIY